MRLAWFALASVFASRVAAAEPACEVTKLATADQLLDVNRALLARVHVAVTGTTAEVTVDGLEGVRVVTAPDCEQLAAAVAIVIATYASTPDDRRASVAPLAAPPVAVRERVQALGIRATAQRPELRERDLDLVGGVATTTDRTELVLGVRVRRAARSLAFEVHLGDREALDLPRPDTYASVSSSAIELVPCVHRGGAAVCAVGAIGWIRGTSEGLVEASTAWLPTVALGARAAWEQRLAGPVAVGAHLEVRTHLTTSRVLVDHMAVWTSRRIEGWAGFGLRAHFP